jgi:DNA polymerase
MQPTEQDILQLKNPGKLRPAVNGCRRCPLYRNATQGVPGEGPAKARLMLVGEQPGNDEDLKGHPFVGPAGRILDKALAEAGIERKTVFVTNAVKHFKFEPRGKKRLHKRPTTNEINACRIWNELERQLVKPDLVVALGATAAQSLMGKKIAIGASRGKIQLLDDGTQILVTVHPSFLLRVREKSDREREYRDFVRDLKLAIGHVRPGSAKAKGAGVTRHVASPHA